MNAVTRNPRAKTEAKLAKANADKAKPAKPAKPDAHAVELAQVTELERALDQATGARHAAWDATTRARFAHTTDVNAAELASVYPTAKTATNRAAELNAARRTGALIGATQAGRLLDAVIAYGARCRDDWAATASAVRKRVREDVANGADKRKAGISAVDHAIATLQENAAARALASEAATAKRAADKADKEVERAVAYAAKQEPGTATAKAAEKAVKAATDKATKARKASDALQAKLPAKPEPAPRTPAAIVQDVKAAMGDATLPLAALVTMARDLVPRAMAGDDTCQRFAKELGKLLERYPV